MRASTAVSVRERVRGGAAKRVRDGLREALESPKVTCTCLIPSALPRTGEGIRQAGQSTAIGVG